MRVSSISSFCSMLIVLIDVHIGRRSVVRVAKPPPAPRPSGGRRRE
jgi:hypothetical protein